MHYFKFHHEAAMDPKVQLLPAETFRVWVNLLCFASANKPKRGFLPEMTCVAFMLHMPLEEATRIVDRLVSDGLIDVVEDGFTPHNWEGRQGRVDLSTERSKRCRERKRAAATKSKASRSKIRVSDEKQDATEVQRVAATQTQRKRNTLQRFCNANATHIGLEFRSKKEEERTPIVVLSSAHDDDDEISDLDVNDEPYKQAANQLGYQVINQGHRETIEHTRALFGDEQAVAVGMHGMRIHQNLGGEWKYFRAAVVNVKATGKGKRDYVGYVLAVAKDYRSTGIPPPPVSFPDALAAASPPLLSAFATEQAERKAYLKAQSLKNSTPTPDPEETV